MLDNGKAKNFLGWFRLDRKDYVKEIKRRKRDAEAAGTLTDYPTLYDAWTRHNGTSATEDIVDLREMQNNYAAQFLRRLTDL
jgi:hypothetical protein